MNVTIEKLHIQKKAQKENCCLGFTSVFLEIVLHRTHLNIYKNIEKWSNIQQKRKNITCYYTGNSEIVNNMPKIRAEQLKKQVCLVQCSNWKVKGKETSVVSHSIVWIALLNTLLHI